MDRLMKTILLILTSISFLMTTTERAETVYQYELNSISGENISLSDYEGDLLLIVNTASECGFTPQYEGLQELYETYSDQGFKVLGFPANNFGGQEPGTDKEIAQFCEMNYGVSFPMFSKVSVKGDDQHQWQEPGLAEDGQHQGNAHQHGVGKGGRHALQGALGAGHLEDQAADNRGQRKGDKGGAEVTQHQAQIQIRR